MSKKQNAYSKAGVDVGIEAAASRIMYEASKETFKNRKGRIGEVVMPVNDFAALKMFAIGGLPKGLYMSAGADGAGTKVEVAQRVARYDTIAHDLFAMACDDASLRGGEPMHVLTILDVSSLGSDKRHLPKIRELGRGSVAAAKMAGVAILNGEIAQMGKMVSGWGDFPFNWSAVCLWVAHEKKILTGHEMRPGDSIVALREKGLRCNSLSLVRKIFLENFGDEWHTMTVSGLNLGEAVLRPSTIYSKFIAKLHGSCDPKKESPVHGIAHITGGGIPEKLSRVLRVSGLGAELSDLYKPSPVMTLCQSLGNVPDDEALGTFNMGQGMLVVTPHPGHVLKKAGKAGIEAKVAGVITKKPVIRLKSLGFENPGAWLEFKVH